MRSEPLERIPPSDLKPHTVATSATERVSLRLACLVTGDAPQAELTAWTDLPMVDPHEPGPTNGARVV